MKGTIVGINLPCGCERAVVKRMAPDIDEDGHPNLDETGAFIMKEIEDIQESYCTEHTKVLVERQQEAMRALESGASPEEAARILTGGTPLPALTDGNPDDVKEPA